MALLGQAAVAMWWDMSFDQLVEFQDWHSHEHFPERMRIPGFLRGSRWAGAEGTQGVFEGFFVMYELADYETLTSSHYLARLNNPTPWSTRMMPHHRNMVRSQCRIVESHGGGMARSMMTVRFSPSEGGAATLRQFLKGQLADLPSHRGVTGAHLLQTKTPDVEPTEEQKIRGGDRVADWILLLSGYDAGELLQAGQGLVGPQSLIAAGATPSASYAMFDLAYALTPGDL